MRALSGAVILLALLSAAMAALSGPECALFVWPFAAFMALGVLLFATGGRKVTHPGEAGAAGARSRDR